MMLDHPLKDAALLSYSGYQPRRKSNRVRTSSRTVVDSVDIPEAVVPHTIPTCVDLNSIVESILSHSRTLTPNVVVVKKEKVSLDPEPSNDKPSSEVVFPKENNLTKKSTKAPSRPPFCKRSGDASETLSRWILWKGLMQCIYRNRNDVIAERRKKRNAVQLCHSPVEKNEEHWMVLPVNGDEMKMKFCRFDPSGSSLAKRKRQRKLVMAHSKRLRTDICLPPSQRLSGISPKVFRSSDSKHQALLPIRGAESLSADELKAHVSRIRLEAREVELRGLSQLLQKVMDHPQNRLNAFSVPVDPVKLNLPTYTSIIKDPMDLGTIKSKLITYGSMHEFALDVRLVFTNAMKFNAHPNHYMYIAANHLLGFFNDIFSKYCDEKQFSSLQMQLHSCLVCGGNTCAICEQKCIEYASPSLYCSGKCEKPIRRGTSYYTTPDGTRLWCTSCYNKRASYVANRKGATTTKKKSCTSEESNTGSFVPLGQQQEPKLGQVKGRLIKKKCEVQVEPWVRCDKCEKWVHQVCGMFNAIHDQFAETKKFVCPMCRIAESDNEKVKADAVKPLLPPSSLGAFDLPTCELSESVENFVTKELERIGYGSVASTLCVRVVSCLENVQNIPPLLRKAFSQNFGNQESVYPQNVPYISKAIYLFQKQDAVDVCLFGMYVQEYDDAGDLPSNHRTLYLAYLDSVQYLRPACVRTIVYQHILVGYFDYMRERGYRQAHIWSSPPRGRASYVFWCRPAHQRTPGHDHLRNWYEKMLLVAKEKGVIKGFTTFYDRYFKTFAPEKLQSMRSSTKQEKAVTGELLRWPCVEIPPCFDGDYWPAEAERLIRRKLKNGMKRQRKDLQHNTASSSSTLVCEKDKSPLYLKDIYDTTEGNMKAMKDDILVVDLMPMGDVEKVVSKRDRLTEVEHSRFLSTRNSFHQLCATSHYQFDSLRRAKHSSMMMLHHLFNGEYQQSYTFCNTCGLLISRKEYWHCTVSSCEDFALCDWCEETAAEKHDHPIQHGIPPCSTGDVITTTEKGF